MQRRKMFVLLITSMGVVFVPTCVENMMNAYKTLHNEATSTTIKDNIISDIYASTEDFARKYGYPLETHTVLTEDGYLLTVHRIPYSPKSPPSALKKPVLVQHGIFSSSDSWLIMGPGKALGLLLADEGYDVWLGNARGNYYSKSHVSMSSADPNYWNFTFHEVGVYDLPAVINHILNVTGHQQLVFVAQSMGNTEFFAMASSLPEYNQKISLMVALCPVVFIKNLRSVSAKILHRYFSLFYGTLKTFGVNELLPRSEGLQTLMGQICREELLTFSICLSAYFSCVGTHVESFNKTLAPVILSHILAGSSLNTLAHIMQNYDIDRFQEYDPTASLGRATREYDLSQVTAPVSIHYAEQDVLLHPDGVAKLKTKLRNVVKTTLVPDPQTTHADFVYGMEARENIYNDVFAVMRRYA